MHHADSSLNFGCCLPFQFAMMGRKQNVQAVKSSYKHSFGQARTKIVKAPAL